VSETMMHISQITSVGACFNETAQGRVAWLSPLRSLFVGSFAVLNRRHAPPGLTLSLQALLPAMPCRRSFDADHIPRDACGVRAVLPRPEGRGLTRTPVNVPSKQFARRNIERSVAAMRNRGDFEPGELELKVTKGMVMHDIAATRAKLKRLQSLGVIVSIDDFGTAYSSLSYLRRLPLDKLKFDQSFVRDIVSGRKAQRLVRKIIDLAHALGFDIVAESMEQARFLRAHGCERLAKTIISPNSWWRESSRLCSKRGRSPFHRQPDRA